MALFEKGEEKMTKNLVYDIHERPKFTQLIIFALQQLLAIVAATIAVPAQIGNGMTASAALFGAGIGTLVYQLFTKFRSPVFLGSSFAFIGPMSAAFAGAASMSLGYLGLVIGAFFGGLVYVVISLVIKLAGINWINKIMPPVVIGPTVALIGLSLSSAAVNYVFSYGPVTKDGEFIMTTGAWVSMICALVTFFVVILCSTYGKKMAKLIPFIIGVVAGYLTGLIFTVIGYAAGLDALKIIDLSHFTDLVANGVNLETFFTIPEFSFLEALKGVKDFDAGYLAKIFAAYVPVAFVVFAEHIADHKNLSSIIGEDLIENPGLNRTLLGDGVGSMVGAFFGGCPNTTYGESVSCIAITRNASVVTITTTAIMAMIVSFVSPLVAFLDSIPGCVMGGVCITLYGFIAVSGLKMLQPVDLNDNRNLFVVAAILVCGIGGLPLKFGPVEISAIATALILGIIVNVVFNRRGNEKA